MKARNSLVVQHRDKHKSIGKKTVDGENLFFKALANGQYQKGIYGSTKLFMADHLLNALHEKVNDLSLKVGQM